jgi:hypothetical protein
VLAHTRLECFNEAQVAGGDGTIVDVQGHYSKLARLRIDLEKVCLVHVALLEAERVEDRCELFIPVPA